LSAIRWRDSVHNSTVISFEPPWVWTANSDGPVPVRYRLGPDSFRQLQEKGLTQRELVLHRWDPHAESHSQDKLPEDLEIIARFRVDLVAPTGSWELPVKLEEGMYGLAMTGFLFKNVTSRRIHVRSGATKRAVLTIDSDRGYVALHPQLDHLMIASIAIQDEEYNSGSRKTHADLYVADQSGTNCSFSLTYTLWPDRFLFYICFSASVGAVWHTSEVDHTSSSSGLSKGKSATDLPSWTKLSTLGAFKVRKIACAPTHTMALTDTGDVYSWVRLILAKSN